MAIQDLPMDLPVIDLDLYLSKPLDSLEVIHECKKACNIHNYS
jgi:hypothetical protein